MKSVLRKVLQSACSENYLGPATRWLGTFGFRVAHRFGSRLAVEQVQLPQNVCPQLREMVDPSPRALSPVSPVSPNQYPSSRSQAPVRRLLGTFKFLASDLTALEDEPFKFWHSFRKPMPSFPIGLLPSSCHAYQGGGRGVGSISLMQDIASLET